MNVLICSDSHTRLDLFQKVMELEKPEVVIFAGDHSTDAIDMSYVYQDIPFIIVRGNCDFYDRDTKDRQIFELNGKKIMLTHGHIQGVKMNLNELEKEARQENVDICIYGHTHIEFYKKHEGTVFLNPGALQDKKYVIYNGEKFTQKYL